MQVKKKNSNKILNDINVLDVSALPVPGYMLSI